MKKIRNIGIFAHVDAGKTTLTEQLLRHSGAIRTAGAVDSGTAHTDRLDIERRRGISVRSTCASLEWKGVRINLIDTPGHADFAAEVERSMWALDGAVLLLSAADGVQPQTEVLFEALKRQGMPTILFINKTDREGADVPVVISAAREQLSPRVCSYADDESLMEAIADADEAALDAYLEGNVYPRSELEARISAMVLGCEAYPALCGSALRDTGVEPLLDAILQLLPEPDGSAEGPLAGVVFAIENDRVMGRAAHVRMFSGSLKNRDSLELPAAHSLIEDGPRTVQRKITQVREIALEGRANDLGGISAGEIGAVYGLGDIRVGQILGEAELLPRRVEPGTLRTPLLMVKVVPPQPDRLNDLRNALNELSVEDPLLSVEEYSNEMHVRVMGAIQLEVLEERLRSGFNLPVTFGSPSVIYRETIAESAEGFFAYVAPKPCWAIIRFKIDPLPRGSGVQFESQVHVRDILLRYQHQVENAIPLAIKQGMLGWQVDDVKITLIEGNHHQFHTHPLDFIVATPVAFLDGMRRGGSVLLEPVLEMRLTVPEECGGRLLGEIIAMRGETVESTMKGGMLHILANVPLATSVDFSIRLASMTSGRGAMSVRLKGYQDCPLELGNTCPRRGVHPLDTSKYILAARSALEGGIFDR